MAVTRRGGERGEVKLFQEEPNQLKVWEPFNKKPGGRKPGVDSPVRQRIVLWQSGLDASSLSGRSVTALGLPFA